MRTEKRTPVPTHQHQSRFASDVFRLLLRRRTCPVNIVLEVRIAIPEVQPLGIEYASQTEHTSPVRFPRVRQAIVVAIDAGSARRQRRPATQIGLALR